MTELANRDFSHLFYLKYYNTITFSGVTSDSEDSDCGEEGG